MDLSVIIVNYRGWDKLRECLAPFESYRSEKYTVEVIVVDNNSDDGILESFIKDFPGFRFVGNEINGGFASGCNKGAEESSGKYLLFLNPDTVASGETAGSMLERAMRMPGKCICSCRQKDAKGEESVAYGMFLKPGVLTGTGRAIFRLLHRISGKTMNKVGPDLLMPDWVSGSVIMIKRDFFSELGGFDERFWMYYEDMDLCKRARDGGGEIFYFTDITIEHKHGGISRMNPATTALTKTEVKISRHLYISKHFAAFEAVISQTWLVMLNVIGGLFESVAGILLFFIPGVAVRTRIYARLMRYYCLALCRGSWISPRSVVGRFGNQTNRGES